MLQAHENQEAAVVRTASGKGGDFPNENCEGKYLPSVGEVVGRPQIGHERMSRKSRRTRK